MPPRRLREVRARAVLLAAAADHLRAARSQAYHRAWPCASRPRVSSIRSSAAAASPRRRGAEMPKTMWSRGRPGPASRPAKPSGVGLHVQMTASRRSSPPKSTGSTPSNAVDRAQDRQGPRYAHQQLETPSVCSKRRAPDSRRTAPAEQNLRTGTTCPPAVSPQPHSARPGPRRALLVLP